MKTPREGMGSTERLGARPVLLCDFLTLGVIGPLRSMGIGAATRHDAEAREERENAMLHQSARSHVMSNVIFIVSV